MKHKKSKEIDWFDLYTDSNNEDTFLDPIESAIQAGYGCRTRVEFATQSNKNLRKLKSKIGKKLKDCPDFFTLGVAIDGKNRGRNKITLYLTDEEFSYLVKQAELFESDVLYVLKMLMRRGIAWERTFDNALNEAVA